MNRALLLLLLALAILADALFSLRSLKTRKPPSLRKSTSVSTSIGITAITVAVIDTGVDISHPELSHSLWTNPNEIPGNGIDDDHNGFIDDVHGWNFVDGSGNVQDHHGHGTHISGIIHHSAPQAQIMALKYFDTKNAGAETLTGTVRAIRYATRMGARIINFSGGGLEPDPEERAAIAEAEALGILFIAAAGNERSNSDSRPFYPAGYGLSNIVSVTAVNPEQVLLPTSNFGVRSVDIAALGASVVSTLPDGRYGAMTGTSQATAFVTGAAARLMADRPDLQSPTVLRRHLLATGLSVEKLVGKTRGHSVVDTASALMMVGAQTSAFGHRTEEWNPAAAAPQFTLSTSR